MVNVRRADLLLPARCQTRLLATRRVCRDRDDAARTWPAEHSQIAIAVGGARGRAVHDSRVVHVVRPGGPSRERLDVVWAVEAGTEPGVCDRGLRLLEHDAEHVRRMCLSRIEPGSAVLAHLGVRGALPVPLAHGVGVGERWSVDLQLSIETGDWPIVAVGPHPVEVLAAAPGQVVLRVQSEEAFELDIDLMVDLHGLRQAPTEASFADELAVLRAGLIVERQWLERARQARVPGVDADTLRRGLAGVEIGEHVVEQGLAVLEALRREREAEQLAWRSTMMGRTPTRDDRDLAAAAVAAHTRTLLGLLGALGSRRLPRRLASTARVMGAELAARVGITVEPWRGCRRDALGPLLGALVGSGQAARR